MSGYANAVACDECGRFISYRDIEDGSAVVRLVTPSSALTFEEYERLCKTCAAKEKERNA